MIPDSLTSRRIRVHLHPIDRAVEGYGYAPLLRGTLLAVTADSITLRVHEATSPISIAASGVRRIDVSRGVSRTHSAIKSGLLGSLVWWSHSYRDDADSPLLWAAGGFVLGATFGAIFPEERWKRIFRR